MQFFQHFPLILIPLLCVLTTGSTAEAEKFDAKPRYKKFLGYRPGVAVIGDMIVGIENRQNEARAETKLALAMPCEEKEAQRATATATLTFVSTRRTR